MRRITAARRRLEAERARTDTRAWVMERRERTRRLVELGGLVELTGDGRAALYGALLTLAATARAQDGDQVLGLWRRRGRRAFESNDPGS